MSPLRSRTLVVALLTLAPLATAAHAWHDASPCVAEDHSGPGWSTHDTPRWTWGCLDGAAQYEVAPSWAPSFRTTLAEHHASPLATGEHWLRVRAEDAAGEWSAWSEPTFARIDLVPPQAPVLTEVGIGPSEWTNRSAASFRWDAPADEGSGVARYHVDVNGQWLALGSEPAWDVTLADGEHRVRVVAEDAAGLDSVPSNEVARRVDTRPPRVWTREIVAFWEDERGTWISNRTLFEINADDRDGCGVASLLYGLDDGPLVALFWSNLPLFSVEAEDGPLDVRMTASDCAGNTAPGERRSYLYDGTPPSGRIECVRTLRLDALGERHGCDSRVLVGSGQVIVEAHDDGAGLRSVAVVVGGEKVGWDEEPPYEVSVDVSRIPPGRHVLEAVLLDRVHNRALLTEEVVVVPTHPDGVLRSISRP